MRVGGDGGVVGGGDGSDDGEAEAVAVFVVGAAGVEALERLEEPVDLAGRDDRAGVGHREHGFAVGGVGGDLHVPAGDVVADGVVDEVGDEAFDESGVAVERGGADGGLDVQSEAFGVEAGARQDGLADVREVGSLSVVEPALAAGEGEEGFDEAFLFPVGGEELLAGGSPHVRGGGIAEGDLYQGALRVRGVRSSWEALATK